LHYHAFKQDYQPTQGESQMFLRRLPASVLAAALAVSIPAVAEEPKGLVDRGIQAAADAASSVSSWATTGVESTEATSAWRAFKGRNKNALARLERLAARGNADAQNYLGHIYAEGLSRQKKAEDVAAIAARYFAQAAQSGHAVGTYNFALMQLKGAGVQFDEKRAMYAMNIVKDQIPAAAVHLALYHYKRNEYGIAWQNAQFAASRGEAMGAYIAGKMLHEGTASGGSSRQIRGYLLDAAKSYISDAAWIVATTYDDDASTADSLMLSRAYRLIAVGMERSGSKQTPQILAGLSTQEARRAQNFSQNWFKRFKKPDNASYMKTLAEQPAILPPRTY
jgi:TPR repeat protein